MHYNQEVSVRIIIKLTSAYSLVQRTNVLKDVVVTALGIQRNKKELGYAIQPFSAKDINRSTADKPW
ncbi:MAG: hypothetical protein WKF59_10355 [Chitinophagaceae bacterium]